jgi:hypothetical protein
VEPPEIGIMVPTNGRDLSNPRAWLAMAELRGLCKEEAEEQWGVARRVCAQCSGLGKFVIARVEVGDRWKVLAGIEVARKGWRKSFSQS